MPAGWTARQVAELANIPARTVQYWRKEGVIGPTFHTSKPLGNFVFTNDAVDLGGQSAKANKDSIDGQYEYVVFTVA